MESIQKLMDKVKAQIKDQLPTPEQVALGRWIVDGQNSVCLPHCPICNGLGRIWVSFGKTADCPNFPAAKMFRDPRYGLLDTDRGLCWEALIETEANRPAVKAIREVMERGGGWVFLHGVPGVGKSELLKTAVAESMRMKREAVFRDWVDFLEEMRILSATDTPPSQREELMKWLSGLPLLAIDEFELPRDTPFVKDVTKRLMNRRYNGATRGEESQRTVTILASNQSPEALEAYLFDRARDGRFEIVHMEGESLRPVMG